LAIQFNPNIKQTGMQPLVPLNPSEPGVQSGQDFGKAIRDSLEKVNGQQQQSDASIVDLLSGKQQDVNTVVASMAKADMSFKLLVGVRNKLVEAYKETMRMQV
jgi:flagellar hook-basal body complex protein FliE